MKQNITTEQLQELSRSGLEKLRFYPQFLGKDHFVLIDRITFPLLSIGQMIELLSDKGYFPGEYHVGSMICDELWEAVKEKLND